MARVCSTLLQFPAFSQSCFFSPVSNLLTQPPAASLSPPPLNPTSGGTLVIGREQDCQGGCFDSSAGAVGSVSEVGGRMGRTMCAAFSRRSAVVCCAFGDIQVDMSRF
jgi:hypothetical protein